MKNFIKILYYVFPKYWGKVGLNFLFTLLSVFFGLFSFTLISPFLQVLFENHEPVRTLMPFHLSAEVLKNNFNYYLNTIIELYGKSSALLYLSIFVAISVFMKTTLQYASRFVMASVRSNVVRDIRDNLYKKVLKLSLSFYSNERKGDIISRMTNDVNEIEVSVMRSIDIIFRDPMTIIFSLVIMIYMSPQLTLFVLVLLPVTGYLIGKIGSSLRKNSIKAQGKLGEILSIIEETLSGLRIIKAFNAQSKMDEKFEKENYTYTRLTIKIWRRRDLAGPVSEFLSTLVIIIVLWFGGRLVLSGDHSISGSLLITYLIIFSQIIVPAKSITDAYYNIQKGLASNDRIEGILKADISIRDDENPLCLNEFKNEIYYNNVFFKYKDDYVIDGINLKIKKGQTIALVGQSGSGKSTLVDLLPRFYDINEGSISIDGQDIRKIKITDLRKLMGIVSQESILFNDTIFNNIAFGVEDATIEQVIEAAKIANAHEFILETPEGYQTNIGDRGSKLSGGQRQRISIARAILANPPIMILDEATSALDTESEKLVQESLYRLMQNRTSIVIAHRLSTVVHANMIYVIHEGKIIEQGTHNELLALNGQYKKLNDAQTFFA